MTDGDGGGGGLFGVRGFTFFHEAHAPLRILPFSRRQSAYLGGFELGRVELFTTTSRERERDAITRVIICVSLRPVVVVVLFAWLIGAANDVKIGAAVTGRNDRVCTLRDVMGDP